MATIVKVNKDDILAFFKGPDAKELAQKFMQNFRHATTDKRGFAINLSGDEWKLYVRLCLNGVMRHNTNWLELESISLGTANAVMNQIEKIVGAK